MPPLFTLETLVDFVDDALTTPHTITAAHVDSFMREMHRHGVRRVIWGYYGDGHGGWTSPGRIERLTERGLISDDQNWWGALLRTYRELGNPLRVACEAAHRHGIEVYAYFKPYETGPAMEFPVGSPEGLEWGRLPRVGSYLTWLDPFVLENPHLRIKRRSDDLWPGYDTSPVRTLKLYKKDAGPTRVTKDRLSIWASDRNYGYRKLDVPFTFSDDVVPDPRDVYDTYGNLITKRGDPVRVLTLSGLNLTQPFIAVSTDFEEGEADFENAWDRLVVPLDEQGRELPVVYATGTAIWFPELERFPEGGLMFETGRGPEVVAFDRPRRGGRGPESDRHSDADQKKVRGVVAFARGKNMYLSGALCETEPAVQDYWLRCVSECLDAGADGVEFRVENHSCHSEEPEAYGFNDAVLTKVPKNSADLLGDIAEVRTEAYTDFLRRAKRLIKSRGPEKKMRVNLNVDWFRPPADRPGSRKLAYPANIDFPWREWIDEGFLDEAMLRIFAKPFDGIFGSDAVAQEMVSRCRDRGIPVTVNRYVWGGEHVPGDLQRVRDDGRFAGFVLYETWSFTSIEADGTWTFADAKRDAAKVAKHAAWKTRVQTAEHVKRACESLG